MWEFEELKKKILQTCVLWWKGSLPRRHLIYTQTGAAAEVRFSKITIIRWRPKEKNSTCLPPQARGQFGGKYLSRVPHWMITWLPSVTGYINKNIIRAKGSQWGAVKVRLLLKKGDGGRGTNMGQELNRQKLSLNLWSFFFSSILEAIHT